MSSPVALLLALCLSPATADVLVDAMDDAARFGATAGIEPLAVETKEGREGLRMSFECTGAGTLWITRVFEPLEDWTGYGILNWRLWLQSTGPRSHIQVQIFDARNNELRVRREFASRSYGRWLDMSWDFSQARRREGKDFDFGRVRLLIFSAWKDHYGHQEGDRVDYWISGVTRERSWERAGLGVAPVAAPPTLDGRLDEPCWQNAPVAEQFYRPIGRGLPASDTSVRLLWDAGNLYIGIQASSELLDPVVQRLDEFAATITERDGPVFRDDSLEIFLGSVTHPDEYAQLAVNALGTRYDGWGTDSAWDGEWQAVCARHEGYWTAELAVPWETLGIEPRVAGYVRANFFRNDAQHGENSGWSPVPVAHHTPEYFGDLFLLAEAPAVAVQGGLTPVMTVGTNLLSPTLRGLDGGEVTVRRAVVAEQRRETQRETVAVAAGETRRVEVPVTVSAPGEIAATMSVFNAATDALYYQSPRYSFSTAVVALLDMTVRGDATVYCNARELTPGPQGAVQALLEQGANVLGLEAREPVALSLASGETVLDGASGWKQSAEAPAGWLDPSFDDSDWPPAQIADGRLDPAAGRYFRRVMAADFTRIVKLSDVSHIHLLTGAAQHVPVVVSSPVARPVRDASLVLMLPPGVEWIEWGDKKPYDRIGEFAGYETSTVTRDGDDWTRVALRWDTVNPMPPTTAEDEWGREARIFTIGLVVRATTPEPRERRLELWFEGEGGAVRELPREVPLTVHPPLQARTPRDIQLQLWHAFAVGNYGPAEIAALVDTWAQAGFNSFVERTYAGDVYNPLLRARGMRIIAEWVKGRPILALRTADNRFHDYSPEHRGSYYTPICPSWMTTEGREAFSDAVAQTLLTHEVVPDGLMWDMEFGRRAGCFCPRCLQRFSEQFDIEGTLTNEQVVEEHGEQWTDWLCRLWADVSATYREGVRRAVPEGKMYTYSGYQTERNRTSYSIDWTLMGRACDVAVAGYGVTDQIIADTRAALGDTPLLGGVSHWQPRRDDNLMVQYVNLMTWGCRGTTHYQWSPMDGLDYLRVARVATFLADHEEFFTRGELDHARLSGPPAGAARGLRLGERLLAVVVNGASEARTFRLSIPDAAGDFREYERDAALAPEALTGPEGAQIRVEAHDFAAFVGPVRAAQAAADGQPRP